MLLRSVLARELRVQARQPLTYWLRLCGGASLIGGVVACFLSVSELNRSLGTQVPQVPSGLVGSILFGKLNLFVFLSIWILIPLSTADALSRERREGTLPLLFLTELRPWIVAAGKAGAHAVRALTLVLTMIPWLMVPLLFGGVGPREVAMALALNGISMILALSAGFLASAIPRDWVKAVILAELFAGVLMLILVHAHGRVLDQAIRLGTGVPAFATRTSGLPTLFEEWAYRWAGIGWFSKSAALIGVTTNSSIYRSYLQVGPSGGWNIESSWQRFWSQLNATGKKLWFQGVATMALRASCLFLVALWLTAWCVRRGGRDAPEQEWISDVRRTFLRPRYLQRVFRRHLSRALTANPIGWLQQYSAQARMVKWGWCLFIIVAEVSLSGSVADLYTSQAVLGLLLVLALAFSAVGSFRQELETGAFELILVTPIREWQVVFGRIRGLWAQFLPALMIYWCGRMYLSSGWEGGTHAAVAWTTVGQSVVAFLTLPAIGLYFSMRRVHFLAAWLAACAVGVLPGTAAALFHISWTPVMVFQFAGSAVAALLLASQLRGRRSLVLSRG